MMLRSRPLLAAICAAWLLATQPAVAGVVNTFYLTATGQANGADQATAISNATDAAMGTLSNECNGYADPMRGQTGNVTSVRRTNVSTSGTDQYGWSATVTLSATCVVSD